MDAHANPIEAARKGNASQDGSNLKCDTPDLMNQGGRPGSSEQQLSVLAPAEN
ncbi:hypothetical protein [Variovorax sp. N23]|uniref:hypothetical protein n=1 Tax=Variovorax sp. N23 TaxID=2980555 RepID=UPI0021C73040|nr:hypothetical protein [Variovorax sp. N23]